MNIKKELIKKYITPLKESDYVGVEIELPIVNTCYPYIVNSEIIQQLFDKFLHKNFQILNFDNNKNIIAIKNTKNNDIISLEYSVNTIELSLSKEMNIFNLQKKFVLYYQFINQFLSKFNYMVCCEGINPHYRYINCSCLNQDRYKIIEKILLKEKNKLFSQFCAYCCSIQTHINTSKDKIIDIMNMLTLVEETKSNMFANSYMKETHLKNSRKFLWETSNFGPLNTGKNRLYNSLDDLISDYLGRSIFYIKRNNKFYLLKKKTSLNDYFCMNKVIVTDDLNHEILVSPKLEDFTTFRSYKSIEITRYGTLEIRTDCTPKYEDIFRLVAFNVGICRNYEAILFYINKNHKITEKQLLKFAILGLKKRGYKEESLLEV